MSSLLSYLRDEERHAALLKGKVVDERVHPFLESHLIGGVHIAGFLSGSCRDAMLPLALFAVGTLPTVTDPAHFIDISTGIASASYPRHALPHPRTPTLTRRIDSHFFIGRLAGHPIPRQSF